MGNYLPSFRAPPPEEDERQHPLYYDWTVPKWSPFLVDQANKLDDERPKEFVSVDATRDSSSSSSSLAKAYSNDNKAKQVQAGLKDMLTSTVDTNSTKPANLDTHKSSAIGTKQLASSSGGSQIAKSTALHKPTTTREAANNNKSSSTIKSMKSNEGSAAGAKVKRVDQTRPHTVEPMKYGRAEDAAAIKAATNIHAIKVSAAKKASS